MLKRKRTERQRPAPRLPTGEQRRVRPSEKHEKESTYRTGPSSISLIILNLKLDVGTFWEVGGPLKGGSGETMNVGTGELQKQCVEGIAIDGIDQDAEATACQFGAARDRRYEGTHMESPQGSDGLTTGNKNLSQPSSS